MNLPYWVWLIIVGIAGAVIFLLNDILQELRTVRRLAEAAWRKANGLGPFDPI